VPGGLGQAPIVAIYFEKGQKRIDYEKNVIDKLEALDRLKVFWEYKTI
jgi:hypothetical protein